MKNPYRKTYRCVVEGQQEKMYLEYLARLLSDFPVKVVKFNSTIGNAYELTKTYEAYDKACLFDFDFNKKEFEDNLLTCSNLNKKSKKQKITVYHAYSNVCFDLWLILHKDEYSNSVYSPDAYKKDVIRLYELPKDANIKEEKTIAKILSQITLSEVKEAISRAKKIKNRKLPNDAKRIGDEQYFDNPDLSIQDFIEAVITDIPQT